MEQKVSTERNAREIFARLELRDTKEAFAKLPEEQRQVISLVATKRMSCERLLPCWALPIGTVRSRLARGREELRRRVAGETKDKRNSRRIPPELEQQINEALAVKPPVEVVRQFEDIVSESTVYRVLRRALKTTQDVLSRSRPPL